MRAPIFIILFLISLLVGQQEMYAAPLSPSTAEGASTIAPHDSTPRDSIPQDSIPPEERLISDNDPEGRFPAYHIIATPQRPKRPDVVLAQKKHFWRAAAETFGMNMALWSFDRFVLHGHYAYINFNTIKENFRHGFYWDNDHLSTNMFAHPYNGSLYYEAGRSNGFNYWQSELFAISGSAMWELFMEREYPSTNDIIATPIGGAALGEVFYRVSDLMTDDTATGWDRFGHELGIFIVAPMRGITRLVTGQAWKRRPTTGRRFGIPPISLRASLGGRMFLFHDDGNLSKAGATLLLDLEYGDRFSPSSRKPYDYFNILVELDAIRTQPLLNRVEIRGRLLSRDIIDTRSSDLSVGLYQHFDFFDSDTITRRVKEDILLPCVVPYKLGTPASIGGGLMFRKVYEPQAVFEAYAHLNGVILGGVLSDYYRYYHRNYNWASGFSIKSGLSIRLPLQRLSLRIDNRFYRLYTWKGWYRPIGPDALEPDRALNVQGDDSRASFNMMEVRASYRVWKRLHATIGFDWYHRRTKYVNLQVFNTETGEGYVANPCIISQQLALYMLATYEF
ncbi:MAG: DUF3943 domain-containing protein [Bacteroides sp.]|nr:DUF3943 domain-containing protein [Bacteroides sp.]